MSRRYPLKQLAYCLPLTIRSAYQARRRGTIHYLHHHDDQGRATRELWVDLDDLEAHYKWRHRQPVPAGILARIEVLDQRAALTMTAVKD